MKSNALPDDLITARGRHTSTTEVPQALIELGRSSAPLSTDGRPSLTFWRLCRLDEGRQLEALTLLLESQAEQADGNATDNLLEPIAGEDLNKQGP